MCVCVCVCVCDVLQYLQLVKFLFVLTMFAKCSISHSGERIITILIIRDSH